MATIKNYLSFVKFSHTIFAMPFAMTGLALGFRDAASFDLRKLLFVVLCMVFARNAAMGFNRYADRRIDALNPRTAVRELPRNVIRPHQAVWFVILNALLFCTSAWMINPLCFYLSPVALAVVLGYSFTKRFTALCHLVLGLGLALAPVGAYIAVTEHFSPAIIILGLCVLTWVAGFDILYALQDVDFDKSQRLNSIPVLLGVRRAQDTSLALHITTAACVIGFGWLVGGKALFWIGAVAFIVLLVWQHKLVRPLRLERINLAFFTTNGVASLIFGACAATDFLLPFAV